MKPFKLFLFFTTVLLVLGIFSWITPQEGWNVFGSNIQFLKYEPASIAEFPVQNNDTMIPILKAQSDSIVQDSSLLKIEVKNDSSLNTQDQEVLNNKKPKKDAAVTDSLIYTDNFIDQISKNDSTKQQLRIFYYGDSQIENDRITSTLRHRLQQQFGGSGRGLVPITDIYNSANNFIMSISKNWKKTSVVGSKSKNLNAGILCESYSIKKNHNSKDSLKSSFIKIKSINPSNGKGYTMTRLYYQSSGNSHIEVIRNEKAVYTQKLVSGTKIQELKLNFGEQPNLLELKLSTDTELIVYGLSLETPTGIQVDNIALRGKSLPEFTRLDSSKYMEMAKLLKPSFVILHYGVNVVPNVTSNYNFYKDMLSTDIRFLKQKLPGVPILLISTSDMAHRVKGNLSSYANIPDIVKAQKEAALANNCDFWNLYETMGGQGSMIEWVKKIPPLGNKDFVHFTPLGASGVGVLLYNRLVEKEKKPLVNEIIANEFAN